MSGRRRRGSDDWTEALDGVRPLKEKGKGKEKEKEKEESGPGRRSRARPKPRESGAAARFHHPDPTEPGLGFADGISRAQLRQLQQGRIRPDRRVDLHGQERGPARRRCLDALREALAAGERCVLVVHGKGLRSAEGAVLRPALPGWLADPSLEGRVLAFAPAKPPDGGRGASYVLLRRARREPDA